MGSNILNYHLKKGYPHRELLTKKEEYSQNPLPLLSIYTGISFHQKPRRNKISEKRIPQNSLQNIL